MYDSTTTVTVGLDVHARSVRLAAVRADELLEERTLPYDEDAVERALRRWPRVRCCYEAGPTGFSPSWPTPDTLTGAPSPRRSAPRLLTDAPRGGLRPPPAERPRRPTSPPWAGPSISDATPHRQSG